MPVNNSELDRSTTLTRHTPTSPSDEAPVYATADRVFTNYQLLDTGQRSHYASYKKRFRDTATINNTNQATLQFYTAFVLDDDAQRLI